MSAKPKITCLGACRGPRTFPPCSSSTEPPFHQEGLLLALHIFYTRTEGVMIHFSSSSSFCSSIIHSHLKSSNPTETSNSHLFKSATQKSQERSSRAPFASKMFSNDLRIPLVCSRACNDSSTSSSTSWAFSRMYSNLLSCAMKPLDILGLPEDLGPSRVSCPYHGWEFEPHNSRSCRYPLVN